MNIIFGNDPGLDSKHIVLELDTIRIGVKGLEQTAYCVVENIPFEEMPAVQTFKELHATLMTEYRNRRWGECDKIIAQLIGKWGGELDTFYAELRSRIDLLKTTALDDLWNGIIDRS